MNEREKGDFLIPVRTPVRTHVPGPKAPWPLCQIISKPHLIIKQLCVLDASDIKDLGCRALANSFIDPVSFLSALFQPIFWHLTSWWGPHSTLVCYNLRLQLLHDCHNHHSSVSRAPCMCKPSVVVANASQCYNGGKISFMFSIFLFNDLFFISCAVVLFCLCVCLCEGVRPLKLEL